MANQKQGWTFQEEEAFKAAMGDWNGNLAPYLTSHSNNDLQDNQQNMRLNTEQIIEGNSEVSGSCSRPATADGISIGDDSDDAASKHPPEGESKIEFDSVIFDAMIFHALSSMNSPTGSDIDAIVAFIEEMYGVPGNLTISLIPNLTRLVSDGILEKVGDGYKIKSGIETPLANQPDVEADPSPINIPGPSMPTEVESIDEAARRAAYEIAEAENRDRLAALAFQNFAMVSKMAEEMESIVQIITEIKNSCDDGGI